MAAPHALPPQSWPCRVRTGRSVARRRYRSAASARMHVVGGTQEKPCSVGIPTLRRFHLRCENARVVVFPGAQIGQFCRLTYGGFARGSRPGRALQEVLDQLRASACRSGARRPTRLRSVGSIPPMHLAQFANLRRTHRLSTLRGARHQPGPIVLGALHAWCVTASTVRGSGAEAFE
jgi:hypothetical protein